MLQHHACNAVTATSLIISVGAAHATVWIAANGILLNNNVQIAFSACSWDILGLCGNLGQIQGTNAVAAESRNLDRLSLSARLLFWEYLSFLALGCMHTLLPIAVKFAAFREAVKERIKNIGSRSER